MNVIIAYNHIFKEFYSILEENDFKNILLSLDKESVDEVNKSLLIQNANLNKLEEELKIGYKNLKEKDIIFKSDRLLILYEKDIRYALEQQVHEIETNIIRARGCFKVFFFTILTILLAYVAYKLTF